MAKRILFQGDSITDCGRNRNDFFGMGNGYPNLVKASLGFENPGEYEFINRGIGGNRIADLYARIKEDFINLKPDYASIFVGVNDVGREITSQSGAATDKFEKIYTMLIDEVKAACPDIKLIIIAPFVLEGELTRNTEEYPEKLETFKKGVAEKAAVAKKIAEKYGLPLIDLQSALDEACTKAPAEYWSVDGVHLTACGHEIIKRLWLQAFNEIKF